MNDTVQSFPERLVVVYVRTGQLAERYGNPDVTR